jgi:hypothetical protein
MKSTIFNFMRPKGAVEWTVAVFFSIFVSVVSFWAIVDRNPLESSHSEVVTKSVHPGDSFSITYQLKWKTSCTVRGYRFVIDSANQQYTIAPDERRVSPLDHPQFTINIPIPDTATAGPAKYRATIIFACNPYQQLFPIEREVEDEDFVILPKRELSEIVSQSDCPSSKPVFVANYCRGLGVPKKVQK